MTKAMLASPNDLTYFLEVANLLNLSRTASSLGISQPSLTQAMQRLEASLGTTLLMRHKRGVTLTKAGKQLQTHARQLLQQWDTIKSNTLATMHDVQGSFIIGCHPSIALYSFPYFLADLLEKHNKLEIKLQHDLSRRITDAVINLTVDIGIVVNPIKHADLVMKKVMTDKVALWHSGSTKQIQNIQSGHAVLVCDLDLVQTQSILKKLKKQHVTFSRLMHSNSLEVIADLTASSCGIGILPSSIASRKNLFNVPNMPIIDDEIYVIYRGENHQVRAVQTIATAIIESFKRPG